MDLTTQERAIELQRSRYKLAEMLCQSSLIPKHFQGKPADVLLVMGYADAMHMDHLWALQSMHTIHGTLGMKTTLLIAMANKLPQFKGGLRWRTEGSGQDLKVYCYTRHADTDEVLEQCASMAEATRAGWTKNPLYKSIPETMLNYRAATKLVRLYAPEVTCGLYTVDELQDINASRQPAQTQTIEDLAPREAEVEIITDPSDGPVFEPETQTTNA